MIGVTLRRERRWASAGAPPQSSICARFVLGGTCDRVLNCSRQLGFAPVFMTLLFCSGNEIHAPVDIRVIDGTFGCTLSNDVSGAQCRTCCPANADSGSVHELGMG